MQLTEKPNTLKKIGESLKKKRDSKGLSLMGVARLSGLSGETVANAEAGKNITIGTLIALGRAYNLRLSLTIEDAPKQLTSRLYPASK